MSAEDVGHLARRLTTGLYVHAAALELDGDPRVRDLIPAGSPLGEPPAGLVQRKDGTLSAYDWLHHLNVAKADPVLAAELDRAWFVSALVVLGDPPTDTEIGLQGVRSSFRARTEETTGHA